MKKILFKTIAIVMAVLTALACVGCSCKDDEQTNGEIKETNYDLLRNGTTDYVIVYSETDSASIIDVAVNELTLFIKQASGVEVAVKKDSEAPAWTTDSTYISVGNTAAAETSGAKADVSVSELSQTGYTIKNVGKSVFLLGGEVFGTLHAAYRFLHEQFNFECYAADEIAIDMGVTDRKLLDFDNLKVIPDIEWRLAGEGELMNNAMYLRRLGYQMEKDYIVSMGGRYVHNFCTTVNPDEEIEIAGGENKLLKEVHPEWFSTSSDNLCLTRDLEGLSDYVVEKMKEAYLASPEATAISFTQMDDNPLCRCDTCNESINRYGTSSASYILFMNKCWDKLEDWVKQNFPNQEKYLYMFAYQDSTGAPASLGADGQYHPNAPELKMRKNVIVQIAPIYAASYYPYDAEKNADFNTLIQQWRCLSDQIMIWHYSYYYTNQKFPYFDFYSMSDVYSYLKNNDVKSIFDEDMPGTAIIADWAKLKNYLRSKLGVDTKADLAYYTDMFFQNYFKQAAGTMRELFDSYSTYFTKMIVDKNLGGRGNNASEINHAEYWSEGALIYWINLLNKAYEDIKPLKTTDPAMYKKLEERICLESLTFRFLNANFNYSGNFTGSGNSLAADYARFGYEY